MPCRLQLERTVSRQPRLDAVDRLRIAGARLSNVQLGGRLQRALQIHRPRAKCVGERQQNAADLLGFLFLQRHDVVVDVDRAQWFEEKACAARRRAVSDSRNAAPVFHLHHQHVAAVAFGDDELLKIFCRLLAAQVRFERAAQPRPLFTEPVADDLQLGAGVIDHLPRLIDLLPRLRDLAFE